MRLLPIPLALAALVAACGSVQTTSGADYLSSYQAVVTDPQPVPQRTTKHTKHGIEVVETQLQTLSTDDLIRHAAAIEPLLKLPARIGLARIEGGRLTAIPAGEAALWQALAQRQAGLGTFTPIDPFLADYTALTVLPQDKRVLRRDATDIITVTRLGAARQHVDAVLIYEVGARGHQVDGVDGLAPVRVLGAAPLPAAPIKKEGVARAFLMDVRNGYPYGTASASVDLAPVARSAWSGKPKDALGIEAKTRITEGLIADVEKMVGGLVQAMAAKARAAG